MDKKIDVVLYKWGTFVFGKVLYTDESLLHTKIAESNGYQVYSTCFPQIVSNGLYVWGGSKDKNYRVMMYDFETEMEANNWINQISHMLDSINKKEDSEKDYPFERVI